MRALLIHIALFLTATCHAWAVEVDNYAPINHGRVLRVGPQQEFVTPSMAAEVARDGDIVEIEAGEYPRDVAVWRANGLTLRGVGGRARLLSGGNIAEGKAIWVIMGNNTLVENIEFHDARAPHRNGAGIRQEGANLTVRYCLFRHNENGILTGAKPASDVVVEHTEFDGNGHGDGQSHNIYIGTVSKFVFRFNYSHHARIGHQVKSRAAVNQILFNRLSDESDGTSSYLLDLPAGGVAHVYGNIFHQGKSTHNSTMVSFGAESMLPTKNKLFMAHNTLVNQRRGSCRLLFVNPGADPAKVLNNVFSGCGIITGPVYSGGNVLLDWTSFVNAERYDYHLRTSAEAIDAGLPFNMLVANGVPYPDQEYVHPLQSGRRMLRGAPDAGAFELGTDNHAL